MIRNIRFKKPDYILVIIVFALALLGLVMISSASSVFAKTHFDDVFYYVRRQSFYLVVGVIGLLITQRIDYKLWRRLAPAMLALTLFLLIVVFIPGIGYRYGGAARWIKIGPLLLQPTEILKLTLVLYLAAWLEKKGHNIRDFSYGFLPFVIMLGVIILLVMKQPDMGTMFTIFATSIIMFLISGANIVQLVIGGVIGLGVFWELIKSAPYRMARFTVFLNPSSDPGGIGYHVNQALLAIGSGGIFGRGFGESRQKYLYLPQPFSDSIFAIIGEELGFIWCVLIVILFLTFAYRGFRIAQNAPDTFARLVACGITTWIVIQAFINIGTMLSILPLTGIPLPFISFGGSSLVTTMVAVGILLNISKQTGAR